MTDAPERMWRERIAPSQMYLDGGSFYHETPTKRPSVEYIRADARHMTLAEAAKVLLDAMEGADGMDISAFMGAADEMARDMYKGLGPIPMLSSALRALSQPHN